MAHHRLGLLHGRTADLSAHPALLHLTGCHLDLRGQRPGHTSGHSGGRAWGSAPVWLQLSSGHARRLRNLSVHRVLIISVCACRTSSSSCGHGRRLRRRHAIRLGHALHIALLCVAHLLGVLLVLRASLAVTLRRENRRCLLIRVHLLLLCR